MKDRGHALKAGPWPAAAVSGEQRLIERIRSAVGEPPPWVHVGIGDDAAVVETERNTLEVLTTDTLVEGVHWDPTFCSPADIGHKSLAVNLSDLAAMGAVPRAALLSLSVRAGWARTDGDGFIAAFAHVAREHRVVLIGGNVTSSPGPAMFSVTLTGTVRPRRVLTRDRGRPGDELYVTGSVGAALAGLLWLREHPSTAEPGDAALAACVRRYRRPEPRLRVGQLLGRNQVATSCIDLSDGLADGIRRITGASGAGARVEGSRLPIDAAAAAIFRDRGLDPGRASLEGGDDYELLFTVSPKRRRALDAVQRLTRGVALTRIGVLTGGSELVLLRDGREEPLPEGFAHF